MRWPWLLGIGGALLLLGDREADAATFGGKVVQVARRSIGVREIPPGSNRSPEIDAWLKAVGQTPGNQWCAAFVSYALRQAGKELGVAPPIAGSALAKALKTQFQAAGRWVTAAQLRSRRAPPGSVAVWDRSPNG